MFKRMAFLMVVVVSAVLPGTQVDPASAQASNEGVIRVNKMGGRAGSTGYTPLEGAVFEAYGSQTNANNRTNPVASCTTNASGICTMNVQTGLFGDNFWVREITAPDGYFVADVIASGSSSNPQVRPYVEEVRVTRGNTVDVPANESGLGSNDNPAARMFADPLENPPLPTECGLSIAMVVDLSGSVSPTELNDMRAAINSSANALVGTASGIGLFSFNTTAPASGAPPNLPLTSVQSSAAAIENWTAQLQNPGPLEQTNWDRGLQQVADNPEIYDLVLFMTDGVPTARGPNPSLRSLVRTADTEQAVASANAIKAKGTPVISLGIGNELAQSALYPLSGSDPGEVIMTDFTELDELLTDLALAGCLGSVTITKQTRETEAAPFVPAAGWTFSTATAEVTPPAGVTDDSGQVVFSVDPGDPPLPREVTFAETLQDGYELVPQAGSNAVCTSGGGSVVETVTNSGPLGFTVTVELSIPPLGGHLV